jgi:tyrosine-protein kinase Etk/Wzc
MSDLQATPLQHGEEVAESPFLGAMIVLAKHKHLVLGLPLVFTMVAVLIAFSMPNIYRADTKILPPQHAQAGAAALMAQLNGVAGVVAGTGIRNPNDLYIGMLKSRVISDAIIRQFDLKKVYGTDSLQSARQSLAESTTVINGKDGLINIEVDDEVPQRAAQIATAYTSELLRLTKVLALTEASQRRLFLERELQKSKDNLAESEAALNRTLDTHGVISVDMQSRAIAESSAQLRAQITAKEIQLSAMQAFVTTENLDFKKNQQQLRSMRDELEKLENGSPSNGSQVTKSDKPSGLENIKILRNAKYYQMLYEMLSKQYEIARLDEAKDATIIQVLEAAIEPERKFKPKRAVIAVVACSVGFLLAIAAAFWLEWFDEIQRTPKLNGQLNTFKALLRFRN